MPDPRCGRKTKHDYAEVLLCLIMGTLAGRTTLRRSLNWCVHNLEWLRQYLPLKNGIASPATACRILAGIDEELFLYEFMEWIGEILNTQGLHLAIDGKALRAGAEKVKSEKAPMIMNVIEVVTGLVVAQLPLKKKECEAAAIPEILRLLSIKDSVITIDAVGTTTEIMKQIIEQGGNFVLTVKRNQPNAYGEIVSVFKELEEDAKRLEQCPGYAVRYPEIQNTYESVHHKEKNRDRYEYRWYQICTDCSILTKTQKEWPFIQTVGQIRQVRIPIERDADGSDFTPDVKTFLEKGSKRRPKPTKGDEKENDMQTIGVISNLKLSADEIGRIKREHWSIENCLHHVLDDVFREDRSPAKKSKNNLALIRKFAYNLIRIAMITGHCKKSMTDAMDSFCDDPSLMIRFVFSGIDSFY